MASERDDRFSDRRYQIVTPPAGVTNVGKILSETGGELARIRNRPRVFWGCLTILVSVALFFGLPALGIWVANEVCKLAGTDFQRVLDTNLALGIPLFILIFAGGVLGAMMSSWCLYRRKFILEGPDRKSILEIAEVAKYGAASVTARVYDDHHVLVGKIHRNVWGRFLIHNADEQIIGLYIVDGEDLGKALLETGKKALVVALFAIATALLFSFAAVVHSSAKAQRYRILRLRNSGADAEEIGSFTPTSANGLCRILDCGKAHGNQVDSRLLIATAVFVTFYDF